MPLWIPLDSNRNRTSSATAIAHYQKFSCALLDRIDTHVEVPRVEFDKPADDRLGVLA
jgi:hypothetical protein